MHEARPEEAAWTSVGGDRPEWCPLIQVQYSPTVFGGNSDYKYPTS